MSDFNWECIHRGTEATGELFECGCSLGKQPLYPCSCPEVTQQVCATRVNKICSEKEKQTVAVCAKCDHREERRTELPTAFPPETSPAVPAQERKPIEHPGDRYRPWKRKAPPPVVNIGVMPLRQVRLDTSHLPYDHVFNCSIIRRDEERLIALRLDWANSQIGIGKIDDFNRVELLKILDLPRNRWNNLGAEDPRLFYHQGDMHVSYTGTRREGNKIMGRICVARLDGEFSVLDQVVPEVQDRLSTEKNWSWFSWRGHLQCVYWGTPHRVLRLFGDTMSRNSEVEWDPKYSAGEIRGGAPPVIHNGEYYHWFHSFFVHQGRRIYAAGLYTFSVEPPFRPLRIIRHPLLLPNYNERPLPHHAFAVFPCGAYHDDSRGEWVVSYGYYDHWSYLGYWSGAEIERALEVI